MSRSLALVLVLPLLLCGRSAAQDVQPASDLPTRVRAIFLAKCSECHGRSLSRPRAALYLHELRQVASNPEWVVPYAPEKSYLWTLLQNDDMPAKGARSGPLTAEEKETVRAWIAAGAPVPPSQTIAPQPPRQVAAEPVPDAPAPRSWMTRLLAWVGKFHVLVIHFPIALLAAAALGELLATWRGSRLPDPAVRYCVLLGAAGAVAAVALGWLHADIGGAGGTSGLLALHRYLGTTAAVWTIGMVWLSERDSRLARRSMRFRVVLWSGALVVALAAHFGGMLVFGAQFFD